MGGAPRAAAPLVSGLCVCAPELGGGAPGAAGLCTKWFVWSSDALCTMLAGTPSPRAVSYARLSLRQAHGIPQHEALSGNARGRHRVYHGVLREGAWACQPLSLSSQTVTTTRLWCGMGTVSSARTVQCCTAVTEAHLHSPSSSLQVGTRVPCKPEATLIFLRSSAGPVSRGMSRTEWKWVEMMPLQPRLNNGISGRHCNTPVTVLQVPRLHLENKGASLKYSGHSTAGVTVSMKSL